MQGDTNTESSLVHLDILGSEAILQLLISLLVVCKLTAEPLLKSDTVPTKPVSSALKLTSRCVQQC